MSLVFSDQLVDVNRKVTMQLKDVTLKEALTRLLSGINLTLKSGTTKSILLRRKLSRNPVLERKE